jgi:hypothetical protein
LVEMVEQQVVLAEMVWVVVWVMELHQVVITG